MVLASCESGQVLIRGDNCKGNKGAGLYLGNRLCVNILALALSQFKPSTHCDRRPATPPLALTANLVI